MYTIRKLADGNCWMTENLKLAVSAGTAVVTSGNNGTTSTYTPQEGETQGVTKLYDGRYYYTWQVAVAGGGQGSTGEQPYSICPRGWRLPSYSASGIRFQDLNSAYSITSSSAGVTLLKSSPLNFTADGVLNRTNTSVPHSPDEGTLNYYDVRGYYVSSTAPSSANNSAYQLYFTQTSISTSTSGQMKYEGVSVRCLAIR